MKGSEEGREKVGERREWRKRRDGDEEGGRRREEER